MAYRLGVDIGGTFTDFVLVDAASRPVALHKVLTTPQDPSAAFLEGGDELLAANGLDWTALSHVVHGTTLITNATIERRGARTGMLVTAGFADVLDIAREQRYDLFDLRLTFPQPVVPRGLRAEVPERMSFEGTVMEPLDLDAAREALNRLVEAGAEAVAICFLHAYANPEHERRVAALAAEHWPSLYVSASSDVSPFMREYERWTTTTVNAYVQPMADRYLGRLERRLAERRFAGRLTVMTSSGGTATPATARRYPVRLIESGPAAGALMCGHHSERLGRANVLSFDMGGTTSKGALIRGHAPLRKYEAEVARVHGFKKGSGLPLRIPVIDMIEIGSGGGGIAAVDHRGVIAIGPKSAGAAPGPACYGLGGTEPTLTDANLVLGYLDPSFFLGGKMGLRAAAAAEAIERQVGRRLGLDAARAAWGIHETVNEDVARAFRVHAAEHGFDYRGCSMIAFGGSGPIHAARIARKLKAPEVVFPAGAGVMSAFGLLASPAGHETVRAGHAYLDDLDAESLAARFRPLEDEVGAVLAEAGVDPADITIARRLDMRYRGQGYEIEVELPADRSIVDAFAELPALFAANYARVFSISFVDQPLEIVNWKVEMRGPRPGIGSGAPLDGGAGAIKGARSIYVPERGGFADCPVYDRYALLPGSSFTGPALVQERESTCVVGEGDRVRVDEHGNLIVTVAAS